MTLSSGQVYFGRLKAVAHGAIVLTDVFEAVTSTDPKTEQKTTRLVARHSADWHGPLDMTIPTDKLLFIETIGPDSGVGKAIEGAAQH